MSDPPTVTVVVPARNEAVDIGGCIEAIARQDYPARLIEVLVVDGGSTDGTGDRALQAIAEFGLQRAAVIQNGRGTTPSNLNVGLGEAHGELLCRVDARTVIPPHYVRTCVEVLSHRPEVSVVGGAQRALPRDGTARSIGIARALNNRYGMGLSRYRRGSGSGATDTVYLGAFRTADLRAAGGWDERLPTNQDFDLNRRMAAKGVVWFEQSLACGYIPRPSLVRLWEQYVRFGRWKVHYWTITGDLPQPRQTALAGAPPVAGLGAVVWLCRRRSARHTAALTLVGATALMAVETVGADEPAGGIAAHVYGAAAMTVVAGGWLVGLWGAVLAMAPAAVARAGRTGQRATSEPGHTCGDR